MNKSCPNFKFLNKRAKEHVWVWGFTGLSQRESDCSPTHVNPQGTGGPVEGLFQMKQSYFKRKWRGGACAKNISMANVTNNINCTTHIMASHIQGKLIGVKPDQKFVHATINDKTSYWDPIRKGKVSDFLSKNPICGTN